MRYGFVVTQSDSVIIKYGPSLIEKSNTWTVPQFGGQHELGFVLYVVCISIKLFWFKYILFAQKRIWCDSKFDINLSNSGKKGRFSIYTV